MEDRQIVKLFLQRSGNAIAATARKYGSRLLQLASNILRDPRDAEEAVNDTYLALWNAIPPEEPDPLSAYSYRVCRNTALNRYRANTTLMQNGPA
jgi:RNA polymerase sigma-70 factor (ECF subfamily)